MIDRAKARELTMRAPIVSPRAGKGTPLEVPPERRMYIETFSASFLINITVVQIAPSKLVVLRQPTLAKIVTA